MLRPLDHLVLASRNLEAQAARYTGLGFQVGARNRHPWGTQNHIVQLQGAFLELLGLGAGIAAPADGAPEAPFARFLVGYLGQREGAAMLALRSADAARDHAAFAEEGIGHGPLLRFGREATRPDGARAHVGFELAFARSPHISDAGFFACRHLHPENFWSAAQQVHPNTARTLASVIMVAENPAQHAEFLAHFTGQREMAATSMGLDIDTGGGTVEVLTPLAWRFRTGLEPPPEAQTPALAGLRIGVADLARAAACLGAAAAAHGGALVVAPEAAFGAALLFQPA